MLLRMTLMLPTKNAVNQSLDSAWLVFLIFLRLGLISFGGPIAHLGYFHHEFVLRRRWLSEQSYLDLVALCQFLPGPASSQVGIALGLSRAGLRGALAAWAGFTLPSAMALVLFALSLTAWGSAFPIGALHGLEVVAVAVVAQALWGMGHTFCTDLKRMGIAIGATGVVLLWPTVGGQVGVIVVAALSGLVICKSTPKDQHERLPMFVSRRLSVFLLGLLFSLLIGLPIILDLWPNHILAMFNAFYRVGSLVFGGGHVVLPLLQTAVVPNGWISNETFLAGYSAAQAVPGPLFSFAAFLGAAMSLPPSGWLGGGICLLAIFLPSFLLVIGVLPFWEPLRSNRRMQAALTGVNAAVVGLLLAAFYQPVWVSAIHRPADFGLAFIAFAALMFWKLPVWLVVVGCGVLGGML